MSAGDVGDRQAHAIIAASEVFERLAGELDAQAGHHGGAAPPDVDPVGQQQLRAAGARLIDLFAGVFQESVEAYLELAQSIVRSRVAGGATGGGRDLSLRGRPGSRAATTVWIHNRAADPREQIVLRTTALEATGGERIDASFTRLVPSVLRVEAGASASSLLSVAIPAAAVPGVYFGHVLAAGISAGGLAVALVVEGSGA